MILAVAATDSGSRQIGVELSQVAGSASLTLVFFPALVLLAVLGIRFGYYAHLNRQRAELASQTPIWRYLFVVGLLATTYGTLGVLEIVFSLRTSLSAGLMLTTVLILAVVMRRLYTLSSEAGARTPAERATLVAFVGIVLSHLLGSLVGASPQLLAALEGTAALAFLTYGATFYYAQTSQSRLQGTMVDSLLRHLLPVLTFAALVNVTALAYGLGLVPVEVVPHIQVVFVVMTASTLMTATIKLRQNLAAL